MTDINQDHSFGGQWTKEKLKILEKYLQSYMQIFNANERAKHLIPHYIDAFAGTGHWTANKSLKHDKHAALLNEYEGPLELQEGSVKIALSQEPAFSKYVFVDNDRKHVKTLDELTKNYTHLKDRIEIYCDEANKFIREWCEQIRPCDRAVLFLDPYGASIEWETLEKIAKTKSIDMWLLFPLGAAVNRMLPRNRPPDDTFTRKLNTIFGTTEWQKFYTSSKLTLPGMPKSKQKAANLEQIGNFFNKRLQTIFDGVANPKPLYNSRNSPIYLLCFAVGNPQGKKPALDIANHLLRNI